VFTVTVHFFDALSLVLKPSRGYVFIHFLFTFLIKIRFLHNFTSGYIKFIAAAPLAQTVQISLKQLAIIDGHKKSKYDLITLFSLPVTCLFYFYIDISIQNYYTISKYSFMYYVPLRI
jgi:hypothetical protein